MSASDDGEAAGEPTEKLDDDKMLSDFGDSDSDDASSLAIERARTGVKEDPFSYAAHLQLVTLLRTDDLEELRRARSAFSEAFPLPPPVWLEWLEDEVRLATSSNEREEIVMTLVSKALADYVSVDVAVFCINLQRDRLVRGELPQQDFLEWFQSTFCHLGEMSPPLTVAGYVYTNGILVWRAYRDALKEAKAPVNVQIKALAMYLELPLRGNRDERTSDLFPQALSVPGVQEQMAENSEVCSMLDLFEKRLTGAGSVVGDYSGERSTALISQYAAYAASEESKGSFFAKVVWERCAAECFLSPEVWQGYADFANRRFTFDASQVCKVWMRAVKNLPSCIPMWIGLLRACTKLDKDNGAAMVSHVAEAAAPHVLRSDDIAGAEQLSTLLVALCQNEDMRKHQQTAICYNIKESRGWASVQTFAASLDKDEASAARAMEEVIAVFGSQASWWIQYARMTSDRDAVRVIYKRAVAAVDLREELELVSQSWLVFEGRMATPDRVSHFLDAQATVEERMQELPAPMLAGFRSSPDKVSRKRPPPPLTRPRRKRKDIDPASKSSKTANEAEGAASSSKEPASKSNAVEEVPYEPRVIYVNNLDFNVTPGKLQEVFSSAGSVAEVRMPRRKDGAAKGMAYVEFEDDAAAQVALSLHKMNISGREAWVRRSKPPKPKPGARGKTAASTTHRRHAEEKGTVTPAGIRSSRPASKSELRPRVCLNFSAIAAATADATASINDDMNNKPVRHSDKPLAQDDFRAFVLSKKRHETTEE